MRAGDLRHRVTIQRQRARTGDWGREVEWSSESTVWASVTATTGTEKQDGVTKGTDASVRYTVRMRHTDVTAEDRLVHDGRVLDIVSVLDPDGRGRELIIQCVDNAETTNL